jgi:hypothetical protein
MIVNDENRARLAEWMLQSDLSPTIIPQILANFTNQMAIVAFVDGFRLIGFDVEIFESQILES